jgi:hypothetical protein
MSSDRFGGGDASSLRSYQEDMPGLPGCSPGIGDVHYLVWHEEHSIGDRRLYAQPFQSGVQLPKRQLSAPGHHIKSYRCANCWQLNP